MGIRPDDVQYIELYNEYNKLQTNGEKVSYIVATLSLRYGISERKVYDLIKRLKPTAICVQCNQDFLPLKANSPTLPLYRNK